MRLELVIFDCDGVLVDSEHAGHVGAAKAFAECGIDITLDDSKRTFTGLTNEAIKDLAERRFDRKLPDDFVARLESSILEELSSGPLTAIPHAREAVEQAIAAGYKVCVASNGEMAKMRLTLERTGLLPLFHGNLFSKDHVKQGKPAPDLFLHAAASMGAAPENTCVIEDSAAGVTAAIAAGMRPFAYRPSGDGALFAAFGATPFTDMRDLPALLMHE